MKDNHHIKRISGIKKTKINKKHHSEDNSENNDSNLKFIKVSKKQKKIINYAFISLLFIIPIILSIFIRVQPLSLPSIDDFAKRNVESAIKSQLQSERNKGQAFIPSQDIINKELNQAYETHYQENKEMIDSLIKNTSREYKKLLQDENNNTYLGDIDTYYFYRYAKNKVELGHYYDELKNNTPWDNKMRAPKGNKYTPNIHQHMIYLTHKIATFFDSDFSLMNSTVLSIAILMGLLCALTFIIIARRYGAVAGFVASLFMAINQNILTRTISGDNDIYGILFPIIMLFFFLNMNEAKKTYQKVINMIFFGISITLFYFAWSAWWFFVVILFGGLFFSIIFNSIKNKNIKKELPKLGYSIGGYLIAVILIMIFFNANVLFSPFKSSISATQLKVASHLNLWPNVFTTVAELNPAKITDVFNVLDNLFLTTLAIIGLIYLIYLAIKKKQSLELFALSLWVLIMSYSLTKGVRFKVLLTPALILLVGIGVSGLIFTIKQLLKENKTLTYVSNIFMILVIGVIFLANFSTANEISRTITPYYDDGWNNAMKSIENNSQKEDIITSWWDYGHWFKAMANRPVTFDGGSQNTPMAHWVGKMLSTSNENEAIGILRMLACGSNDAFSEVDKKYNDTEKSVLLLNKIIVLRKESARKILEENNYSNQEINNILELTHCNPPNNYVIASKDMVAKSGVWAHFGAWDFNRAKIWALTRSMSLYERREFLMNEFNKTSQEATDISNEIEKVLKSEDTERAANDWITGWPSYISQDIISCKNGENNTISCPINIVISQQGNSRDVISSFKLNLLTRENYFEINRYNGNSLQGRGEILPNEVYIVSFDETFVSLGNKDNENQKANIDVVLVPGQSNTYHAIVSDPKISTSMFTRMFFLQGFGLKQFEQTGAYQSFTTGNVFVYKTDFKEYEEEVSASHILLKFEKNKTEEQVLNEIKQVQKKLTLENFENIAKNVSEDMASAINGGDLGWVKKGTMVEEFENALFNAENNTIIGPIKTDFGYHLIKIKDKRKNYFAE